PWIESRRVLDGVLYVLRTGCQWKAVPAEYGSGSAVHRRFQRWGGGGCGEARWRRLQQCCGAAGRLEWTRRCAASSRTRAALGGGRARRGVVERTHSWFNRCRKQLIRWEKKPQNYLALLQFAATLVVFRLVG